MTEPGPSRLSSARRRRLILRGLLRAVVSTAVLVAAYFAVPFALIDAVPIPVSLVVALVALLCVTTWQLRAITRAVHPRVRAIQALAVTAPLYLLLFAASYFLMSSADVENFTSGALTRLDALYFTVTVFATVGFGDISPASQMARLVVMVQMVMNLLVLGAGIQVFVGAVHRGSRGQAPGSPPDVAEEE
ncbi:potassium channel family protein [Herbiconiux sp. CPCC 205763]|uniref:Potassium channel family protein n=1 Tax=Herbiconiux aconitum TaxID=2970913 RepID=A0ABT2GVN6_9MICO|nr:potassium channel family protein [Herbiconiux aconitum]MCS5718999.1 potassium channel family protein [Herbiconiux aconitum]